ncbi:hypothetical protein [Erythrobacter sp. HL-111]|uniref:hypothetical protein n=1 Tax=Erythrobacter sp. HL-111 TaxID=1798193 RepID=UPI0006DAA583|nr:hypothetical protein [Erythrobacter sp. HL-111]KPP91147.1 MAG: hypothetical protein HLUCCO15_08680 [Erythrobacteraceae bacterium HL-111]SDS45881.1 hypothetical protein SAMN04515621_1603 [Erythrobacter sp. HL-111]
MDRADAFPATARLVLVYNADGGLLNAVKDAVHKAVRPATYPCSLCALTYGWAAMHSDWRRFLFRLPLEKVFLHRDEAAKALGGTQLDLPAILLDAGAGEPLVLVSAAELNAMQHRRALMALLLERLEETGVLAL